MGAGAPQLCSACSAWRRRTRGAPRPGTSPPCPAGDSLGPPITCCCCLLPKPLPALAKTRMDLRAPACGERACQRSIAHCKRPKTSSALAGTHQAPGGARGRGDPRAHAERLHRCLRRSDGLIAVDRCGLGRSGLAGRAAVCSSSSGARRIRFRPCACRSHAPRRRTPNPSPRPWCSPARACSRPTLACASRSCHAQPPLRGGGRVATDQSLHLGRAADLPPVCSSPQAACAQRARTRPAYGKSAVNRGRFVLDSGSLLSLS